MKNTYYSLRDLANRYGLAKDSMGCYIRRNLVKIQGKGIVCRKTRTTWEFNDAAIIKIDQLRDYSETIIIETKLKSKEQRIEDLENKLDKLKNLVIDMANVYNDK